MNFETIGNVAIGLVFPAVILVAVVVVFLAARRRNIAYNSVGFLLIMLSIGMSGAPNFAAPGDIANEEIYKLIAVLAGLFGTAICACVAFKDQASSNR